MLFADDTVLESWVICQIGAMEQTLKSRDFKLSRDKTEYMEWKFSKQGTQDYNIVTIDG